MKKFWLVMAAAALMSATATSVAEASFAFAVSNTGVAGVNNLADTNWEIVAAPASIMTPTPAIIKTTGGAISNGTWLSDAASPPSSWVSVDDNWGVDAPGIYDFQTTFDLTGWDETTASITGRFLADNQVMDVFLNGVALGITGPQSQFKIWTDFVIPVGSNFVNPLLNTLTFSVRNFEFGALNPVGLRVEFTSTSAVADPGGTVIPEPAAVASWLIGSLCAVGMIGLRRRRSGDLAAVPV